MKAIPMLVVGIIFGLALLAAAFAGMDKRDIAILTSLFGGLIAVLGVDLSRRGRAGCCGRRLKPAERAEV